MNILVTGSAGHLGEALVRTLEAEGHAVVGADRLRSAQTRLVGSIVDRAFARECVRGAHAVLHAATLHKPHVATHPAREFVDTNVTGTLNLLEEAVSAGVRAFVFTSTTSAFGRALSPAAGEPAAWISEGVAPVPKNIYGVTKLAAENLCELFQLKHGLPCVVLRTSRFFPEGDDDPEAERAYPGDNLKVNELAYRRVDIEDVVSAHRLALEKARALGFARFVISATTPFGAADLAALRQDAAAVYRRYFPACEAEYARRGWSLPHSIDRVYVNEHARLELGWQPRHDFARTLRCLQQGLDHQSPLARQVGSKGYHRTNTEG
ncbi:MAG TPA: NAD(P)-dependent oxidoreductase [Polyangiaceae bacterium]|nr:NAD(P)-dependent oxidoreductase [Polyangiaceae bacterium]